MKKACDKISVKYAAIVLITLLANTDIRAEPAERRVIEEVIVTAQKRDEAIQDVPISMSVMTNEFMVEQGINDLATALLFVPNVKITAAGFFVAPNARGFTFNNNNKAFEPPLGMAVDGIPYTRIPYFLGASLDVKRIEVLRGPQGTTFGKNTTAGVIHMLTKDPTEELNIFVSAQRGELDRERTEIALSGPLLPGFLNARVAVFKDQREGYVDNTTNAIDSQARDNFLGHDREGLRTKLHFTDLFGSSLKLTYEDVRLDDFGTGLEIIRAGTLTRDFLRRFDPNTDFTQGNYRASLDAPDAREVEIKTINLEWQYDIGDWGLVALAGHSVLEQNLDADVDFTPAPASTLSGGDSSPTDTFEFRVLSPDLHGLFGLEELFGLNLGSSDFVAGVFYQKREIEDSELTFNFDLPSFLGLTVAATGDTLVDTTALDAILSLLPPNILSIPPETEGLLYEEAVQQYNQQAKTEAIFGEFQWHFLPDWTLQIGMRAGREKKSAQWNQFFTQPQPTIVLPQSGLVAFSAEREREEHQFQHKVSINWQPTDNISLFLHRAEAVKGGGFNAFSFRGVDDELAYDAEYTTEWSLNAKTNWLDKTLNANLAIYRMDVDDFQVLIRDANRTNIGIGIARVTNAAGARAQGVEADVQWLPSNWLRLIAAFGYNETEYLNFTNNECPADRPEDGGCNATGKSFPFTPEWNNTLTAMVNIPLWSSGLELTASATVEQLSEQFLDIDLDERKVQEGFKRYKASIGLSSPQQAWSFRLNGENLTNEKTGVRQGDLSPGVFVELPEAPRLIYGQFTWEF